VGRGLITAMREFVEEKEVLGWEFGGRGRQTVGLFATVSLLDNRKI